MTQDTLSDVMDLPPLGIPISQQCVNVRIIDGGYVQGPIIDALLSPQIKGHDVYAGPSHSFLIEHNVSGQTRRLLFDLGIRKDWQNLSPRTVERIERARWDIRVPNNVEDVLEAGDVTRNDIEGIIWSHWHWDHIGDPSQFPSHVNLIVGPGFKNSFMPGWPADKNSVIKESDYSGRNVHEIDFSEKDRSVKIGRFDAFDFFGDGSFYLLDSPGHTLGHLCALARTTAAPASFIFMGGDICHHAGEFRPTPYLPLPKILIPSPLSNPELISHFGRQACPGSIFIDIHPKGSVTEPFYTLPEAGISHNRETAIQSTIKMTELDAADNIFVCIAHDAALTKIMDFYPKSANKWFKEGWADKARWAFLKDFERAFDMKDL